MGNTTLVSNASKHVNRNSSASASNSKSTSVSSQQSVTSSKQKENVSIRLYGIRRNLKSRVARWLEEILKKAGIDEKVFSAHSYRSASTSAAFARGQVQWLTKALSLFQYLSFYKLDNKLVMEADLNTQEVVARVASNGGIGLGILAPSSDNCVPGK
uniref:Tyr recombinase domain-containing protein n=1 Tax=Magallana gigas TaxID=29159 RepID=A0A8W8JM23_MAGGI